MSIQISLRVLPLLLCGLVGCAQTANVRCWQPADIAAGGLRSLAVVGATGNLDQRAAVALEREIQLESSFELVTHRDDSSRIILAGYLEEGGPGLPGLLQFGRDAQVDAVVLVDVLESDVDADPRPNWSSLWGGRESTRTAEIEVQFELIDTHTSEVLARREITSELVADVGHENDELLDRLLQDCVHEFVSELEPHPAQSAIQLAEGPWYSLGGALVRRGARLARRGDWKRAEESWHKALSHNSNDDAALFNLSVAAAHAGDYESAEGFAMEALRIRHTECYASGLARIRELRSDSEAAEDQMRTAVVPAEFAERTF